MRKAYQDEQVAVIDDVLAPGAFAALNRHLRRGSYYPVNPGLKGNAFLVSDHIAYQSDVVIARPDRHPAPEVANFPTQTPMDALIEKVLELAGALPEHLGLPDHDWDTVTLTGWMYPKGAALSWHNDGGRYKGAFTFYAHEEWDPHWGGLFLVSDRMAAGGAFSGHAELLNAKGSVGRYFLPLPNRCIVIKGGAFHTVTRVDENAGDRVRLSVAGFFTRATPAAK